MRVVGLEVEDLKEANIAQQRRPQRAPGGQNSAEGPVPPLPLHVNLHLTTTVRPSRFRVLHIISAFRAFLLFLSAPPLASRRPRKGSFRANWPDSVTGRPVTAANVVLFQRYQQPRGRLVERRVRLLLSAAAFAGHLPDPRNCARLPIAGSAGAGADRGGAHRARLPSSSAQRRVGIRAIQERFSARIKRPS